MRLYPCLLVAAAILSACAEARSTIEELTSDQHQPQPQRFLRAGAVASEEERAPLPVAVHLFSEVKKYEKYESVNWLSWIALRLKLTSSITIFENFFGKVKVEDLLNREEFPRWVVSMYYRNGKDPVKAIKNMMSVLVLKYSHSSILRALEAARNDQKTKTTAEILLDGWVNYCIDNKMEDDVLLGKLNLNRVDKNLLTTPTFLAYGKYLKQKNPHEYHLMILKYVKSRFRNQDKFKEMLQTAYGSSNEEAHEWAETILTTTQLETQAN